MPIPMVCIGWFFRFFNATRLKKEFKMSIKLSIAELKIASEFIDMPMINFISASVVARSNENLRGSIYFHVYSCSFILIYFIKLNQLSNIPTNISNMRHGSCVNIITYIIILMKVLLFIYVFNI